MTLKSVKRKRNSKRTILSKKRQTGGSSSVSQSTSIVSSAFSSIKKVLG